MNHFEEINSILAAWNPIGVPENIAQDEYKAYVPAIQNSLQDEKSIYECLTALLTTLGLEYDASDAAQVTEVKSIVKQLYYVR